MLDKKDLWLMEEELPLDEPSDVLLTLPEIRQLVDPDRDEEELGLRAILDRPEALSRAWRHCADAEQHPHTSKSARRHADVLRAA